MSEDAIAVRNLADLVVGMSAHLKRMTQLVTLSIARIAELEARLAALEGPVDLGRGER